MNDRELLELAVKAYADPNIKMTGSGFFYYDARTSVPWNPLTDDGDALRLAVKLKLDYLYYMELHKDLIELYKTDPYAATRRAIVRAAAEIGKEMS